MASKPARIDSWSLFYTITTGRMVFTCDSSRVSNTRARPRRPRPRPGRLTPGLTPSYTEPQDIRPKRPPLCSETTEFLRISSLSPQLSSPGAHDATHRGFSRLIGSRARRQAQGLDRGGCDETWTLPSKEGRRERREKGGPPGGRGLGGRGPSSVLAPPARQSRGCRERSARGPGPGHRTPYRTRPSLELGQLPTSDAAPDTAPHRAGHSNGHYFPAPDIAPSSPGALDAFPPPPSGGPDTEPPSASG
nr:uncharacterized protein LOC103243857 [Chlorocebus sabaeus]